MRFLATHPHDDQMRRARAAHPETCSESVPVFASAVRPREAIVLVRPTTLRRFRQAAGATRRFAALAGVVAGLSAGEQRL